MTSFPLPLVRVDVPLELITKLANHPPSGIKSPISASVDHNVEHLVHSIGRVNQHLSVDCTYPELQRCIRRTSCLSG